MIPAVNQALMYLLKCEYESGRNGHTVTLKQDNDVYEVYHTSFAFIAALMKNSFSECEELRENPPQSRVFNLLSKTLSLVTP